MPDPKPTSLQPLDADADDETLRVLPFQDTAIAVPAGKQGSKPSTQYTDDATTKLLVRKYNLKPEQAYALAQKINAGLTRPDIHQEAATMLLNRERMRLEKMARYADAENALARGEPISDADARYVMAYRKRSAEIRKQHLIDEATRAQSEQQAAREVDQQKAAIQQKAEAIGRNMQVVPTDGGQWVSTGGQWHFQPTAQPSMRNLNPSYTPTRLPVQKAQPQASQQAPASQSINPLGAAAALGRLGIPPEAAKQLTLALLAPRIPHAGAMTGTAPAQSVGGQVNAGPAGNGTADTIGNGLSAVGAYAADAAGE